MGSFGRDVVRPGLTAVVCGCRDPVGAEFSHREEACPRAMRFVPRNNGASWAEPVRLLGAGARRGIR